MPPVQPLDMSVSSVSNETFMSTKNSLDKQDKLDFISFNLQRSSNVVKSDDVTMSHGWQTLLSQAASVLSVWLEWASE